ncbi:MAG: MBL fold metallo-hydrolase RNA specificity domain-containing protein [Oscillospiraceae bacterium]
MKLMFIGAAHEVTGSCTFIEACGKRFLVDFGMEQGINVYENVQIPCSPSQIDFVLLTHAHIDHSGLLPLLCAGGFSGKIYCQRATADLCSIMLRDSAHIQEFEAEWRSRKGKRKGKTEIEPLYTMADALTAISLLSPQEYEEPFEICEGIAVMFRDAGHLLGSSGIEIKLTENGETRRIIFSGDIGNNDIPLIRDPHYFEGADYTVMESTYGNRLHEKPENYPQALAKVIDETLSNGGNVVIPSFAVGRTQELLYHFRQIKQEGLVKSCPDFPVYIDSPLAIEASTIFTRNESSCYDEEAAGYVSKGVNPITFNGLHTAVTSDESRAINFDKTPKVIISASGMCEAGRIKHHLKHNLWRKECTVLFVGYQSVGTLGRKLVEGAKSVKLFGEEINVAARVMQLPGMSGHADKNGLDRWISSIGGLKGVFVIHGESDVAEEYTSHLANDFGLESHCPYSGATLDLISGEFVNAEPIAVAKPKPAESTPYLRLKAAAERLEKIVSLSSGLSNKELAAMADTLNNLCSRWEQ